MLAQVVRFKSGLSDEEILETYALRASRYRKVQGLIQKYYMRFPGTDEYGAVYLWDSEDDLRRFRESDLARTIPEAYRVQGAPDVQVAEVVMVLHPHSA